MCRFRSLRRGAFPGRMPSLPHAMHRRAAALVAIVLAVVLFLPLQATALPLSVEAAMREAVARAPALAGQRSLEVAAHEDAQRAGTLPDPRLSLGIDNLPIQGPETGRFGAEMMTMRRVGVMQELPSRAKRDARRQLADTRVGIVRSDADTTRLEVARAAAEAWVEHWQAQAVLVLLDELREASERAVATAEARLRGGDGAAAEALAARAERLALENRMASARAAHEASAAGLVRWLGDGAPSRELQAPDFERLLIPPERLLVALDVHARLQQWARREDEAAAGLRLAQAERRPDVSLGLSYGARSAGMPDMVMLEVGVGLPVFTRNRQDRDVAARLAELDAVRAGREDARLAQREALQRSLARWRGLGEEVARYREQLLPIARDRAAVALAAYRSGAPLQPWLDARRDEIELRLAYVQTHADQGRAWAALSTLLPEGEQP